MFTCVQRLLLQRNVHLMLHSFEACLLCSGLGCGPLGDSHAVPNPTRREGSEPGLTFSRLYESPCVLYRNILMQRNKHRHPHCLASILLPHRNSKLIRPPAPSERDRNRTFCWRRISSGAAQAPPAETRSAPAE
jgi:hypothetical protein